MIYPKIPLAQSVIEICRLKGIQHIVISPGSRNAPLTIGFSNNEAFQCYSIVDERCAAFFALGIAQQIKKPVAVVCTSGSALLNYYPALAEAFYSQIPLVVISADRPHDKIDIGDGQTIRQENVFANHSLFNANLTEDASTENDKLIDEAISISIIQKGPVHINVPFEEPLYDTQDFCSAQPNVTEAVALENSFTITESDLNVWEKAQKKLILVGELYPNTIESEIIDFLAKDESVVVFTEKTSNLHHESFISNIDTIITPFTEEDFREFQPDLLITFGGMIVSKRIKAFLRKYKPENHWHIDELRAYDTFGCLSNHFKTNPNHFFNELLLRFDLSVRAESRTYNAKIQEIVEVRKQKQFDFLSTVPYSDFKVFDAITKALPKNIQLQVSNSSAIRYLQLVDLDKSVEVFCNRGTSGIDGSTTTAIGAALANNKPTVLITGDISFFYDSNALWNNYIPKNFKIILVNNGGGGIFRILPGHQETETFTKYFETSHNLNASQLCQMFNFDYYSAINENDVNSNLHEFFQKNEKPSLLEIFTPEKENDKILKDYFKKLL
ncbi:2-succinyl-5-enolpyruvyl-6-hydroxy-3-cyclohexene-1-carboxylic-acid synthase [Flavobacterium okayamense]|uniref:2-succinyl-5-enolpyruvyl-6-hydroxy-3-cyclohexene-1-carboxylate synthase n=1 Tax=Flavobacterium okayamense TaxID=2830782 RepID=A0ABN6HYS0_9FLAO|nr:2-succinyl-5-enolpyruvyl-6-hydroxy-3-cyclohexene-1-carboxylic-acid synthase [Flavobacterium okayamense]BCY29519.1 2-succinyl-5-enolpyruvyl-6-hydroxy-3-cyclohexene-1-carboxylate synthase [Flavobacterium okayamense]